MIQTVCIPVDDLQTRCCWSWLIALTMIPLDWNKNSIFFPPKRSCLYCWILCCRSYLVRMNASIIQTALLSSLQVVPRLNGPLHRSYEQLSLLSSSLQVFWLRNVPPHQSFKRPSLLSLQVVWWTALRFDDDDDDVISSLRCVCWCLFMSCLLASHRLLRSVDDASCLKLLVPGLHLALPCWLWRLSVRVFFTFGSIVSSSCCVIDSCCNNIIMTIAEHAAAASSGVCWRRLSTVLVGGAARASSCSSMVDKGVR